MLALMYEALLTPDEPLAGQKDGNIDAHAAVEQLFAFCTVKEPTAVALQKFVLQQEQTQLSIGLTELVAAEALLLLLLLLLRLLLEIEELLIPVAVCCDAAVELLDEGLQITESKLEDCCQTTVLLVVNT